MLTLASFGSKVGALSYPSLGLVIVVRLVRKGKARANALAYFVVSTIRKKISFAYSNTVMKCFSSIANFCKTFYLCLL